jgi:tRNA nucleotidyltransferase (CCA-adding enzyme)
MQGKGRRQLTPQQRFERKRNRVRQQAGRLGQVRAKVSESVAYLEGLSAQALDPTALGQCIKNLHHALEVVAAEHRAAVDQCNVLDRESRLTKHWG